MVEVTKPTGLRLQQLGSPTIAIETPAGPGTATLSTQVCTCRGPEHPHQHWFLTSPLFRSLTPGSTVSFCLLDDKVIVQLTD